MITRRASVTALVAVAVAGLASGCLSSGGSGGSSDGAGTAQRPGKSTSRSMYGLGSRQRGRVQGRRQQAWAQARTASPSSSPRPRRGTPRSGPASPVATRPTWGSSRSRGSCATWPSRRSSSPSTTPRQRRQARPGARLRRRRHVRRRQGLRPARTRSASRASSGPTGQLQGSRLHRAAKTLDEMLALDRPDQGPAGKVPVVHRRRVRHRRPAGPSRTGSRTSSSAFAGPDNYDKWVTGALKFNSPEIKPAFEYFQKIAFTDGNVRGGTKSIVATNFQTGGNALFDQPAGLLPVQAGDASIADKGGFPDTVIAKPRHRRSA